jgi:hypothetical protein
MKHNCITWQIAIKDIFAYIFRLKVFEAEASYFSHILLPAYHITKPLKYNEGDGKVGKLHSKELHDLYLRKV